MSKPNEKPEPSATHEKDAKPAVASPAAASRPPRPWRMPTEAPGTDQTPSCNPNYRAPKK